MRWIATMALAAVVLIGGCKRPESADNSFRVALVLPGRENDGGWNQSAKEGLDRIKAELGATTALVTNVAHSEMARQVSHFAEKGFSVVICHGHEFANIVAELAAKYPKTRFVVGGSEKEITGAVTIEFMARDASQLAGIVAGEVSQAKKAAFVGAQKVPTVEACAIGFEAGLKGSGTSMLGAQYTDSWDSSTKAREKADLVLGEGADVIYQNVDAAAIGVFQAVQDAAKKGKPAFAIGCNRNQNDMAPEVIVGSVVIDIPRAYLDMAREAKDGQWKPRAAKLGLPGGYVDLVLNEKHPNITADVKSKVDAARRSLVRGG